MSRIIFLRLFLVLSIVLFACSEKSEIDRRSQLDFDHPTINLDPSTPFNKIKEAITGNWSGYKSILTGDSTKALYKIEINFMADNSFRLIESKLIGNKETAPSFLNVDLITIDRYVFLADTGRIIEINFLSDKQLKLDHFLFEKMDK
jgi:hypothetical protein